MYSRVLPERSARRVDKYQSDGLASAHDDTAPRQRGSKRKRDDKDDGDEDFVPEHKSRKDDTDSDDDDMDEDENVDLELELPRGALEQWEPEWDDIEIAVKAAESKEATEARLKLEARIHADNETKEGKGWLVRNRQQFFVAIQPKLVKYFRGRRNQIWRWLDHLVHTARATDLPALTSLERRVDIRFALQPMGDGKQVTFAMSWSMCNKRCDANPTALVMYMVKTTSELAVGQWSVMLASTSGSIESPDASYNSQPCLLLFNKSMQIYWFDPAQNTRMAQAVQTMFARHCHFATFYCGTPTVPTCHALESTSTLDNISFLTSYGKGASWVCLFAHIMLSQNLSPDFANQLLSQLTPDEHRVLLHEYATAQMLHLGLDESDQEAIKQQVPILAKKHRLGPKNGGKGKVLVVVRIDKSVATGRSDEVRQVSAVLTADEMETLSVRDALGRALEHMPTFQLDQKQHSVTTMLTVRDVQGRQQEIICPLDLFDIGVLPLRSIRIGTNERDPGTLSTTEAKWSKAFLPMGAGEASSTSTPPSHVVRDEYLYYSRSHWCNGRISFMIVPKSVANALQTCVVGIGGNTWRTRPKTPAEHADLDLRIKGNFQMAFVDMPLRSYATNPDEVFRYQFSYPSAAQPAGDARPPQVRTGCGLLLMHVMRENIKTGRVRYIDSLFRPDTGRIHFCVRSMPTVAVKREPVVKTEIVEKSV